MIKRRNPQVVRPTQGFRDDTRGAVAIEYVILTSVLAIVMIPALTNTSVNMSSVLSRFAYKGVAGTPVAAAPVSQPVRPIAGTPVGGPIAMPLPFPVALPVTGTPVAVPVATLPDVPIDEPAVPIAMPVVKPVSFPIATAPVPTPVSQPVAVAIDSPVTATPILAMPVSQPVRMPVAATPVAVAIKAAPDDDAKDVAAKAVPVDAEPVAVAAELPTDAALDADSDGAMTKPGSLPVRRPVLMTDEMAIDLKAQ